jgi:hypothetical protein
MTDCFHCGEDDHLSYDCPNRTPRKSAPAAVWPAATAEPTYTPPPFTTLRIDPVPPTPEYLGQRAALGMPSHAAYLEAECPWCKSGIRQQCINVGTSRPTEPHAARLELLGLEPTDKRLRVLALEQLAESRAARAVI